ncbi:urease accessory UreF family protein [Methylosinus sp. sav-2]|uniref:urease accessory protein UreF n=1 Tax=Methylosinus sp. sav-2 TaxID=2485168 RepID=UPI001FD901FE|nr:urease accessory UreF family protein [Methylosinus sp. sav-2]
MAAIHRIVTIIITRTVIMTTDMVEPRDWLLSLLTFMSPAYPVGGFAFSHGLEWAVETGDVSDRGGLQAYIGAALEMGGGWCDLVFLAAAWRAARANDVDGLDVTADLAAAWRSSAETALESRHQGAAFARATCAAFPGSPLDALAARRDGEIAFPVAVGAAVVDAPLDAALRAFAHAFAANLVSAGVRLIPLGQTDGLLALAALTPIIMRAARAAETTPLDTLTTSALRIDIASMRHETQYTRLFRS